jgi:membrane dipeptidase
MKRTYSQNNYKNMKNPGQIHSSFLKTIRTWIQHLTSLVLLILIVTSCGDTEEKLARRADKINSSILTVDTHCDTPMELTSYNIDLGKLNSEGSVDFPRMKIGGLDAEFFAVFIGQGLRNDSAFNAVHIKTLKTLDAIDKSVVNNSSAAEIALTPDDAYRIKKSGKSIVFIGIENGYAIGKDITRIKEYYDRGVRYITLSHSKNNDICDSSTDRLGPENNGLSPFGEDVVREMNIIGMMIDVSHISDEAFYDILKITKVPVIASHSSCRALCESPRNLTDDMLFALKENGGVIQICLLSNYLQTPEPNPELDAKLKELSEKYGNYNLLSEADKKASRTEGDAIRAKYEKLATVKDAVDHIDHVVQVIGIDYVGIGSDFDGGGGIEGCCTVAEMKNITIELLRRGYTKSEIEKIWGGNIMRVMKEVQGKKL